MIRMIQSNKMNYYAQMIEESCTEKQLESVMDEAAFDDTISNSDYCAIYSLATERYRQL